jgi:hypothetical protein
MPLSTFIPVEFPFSPKIWNTKNKIERFLTKDSVAVALNNSQYTDEFKRASIDLHVKNNTLFSSIMCASKLSESANHVIAVVDPSKGHEFVENCIESIYFYVGKIFVESGDVGSRIVAETVKAIKKWAEDSDILKKIEFIESVDRDAYGIVLDVQSNDVWDDEAISAAVSGDAPATIRVFEYLKTPFFRLKSNAGNNSAYGIHRFSCVREDSRDAWDEAALKYGIENVENFVGTVWNKLPVSHKEGFAVEVIKIESLPVVVKDNPMVVAWKKYCNIPLGKVVVVEKKQKPQPKRYSGTLAIMAVIDSNYEPFVPMFKYCIKKYVSYADIKIAKISLPEELKGKRRVSAAVRFLEEPEGIGAYDYVLITDIDIMFYSERMTITDQHMNSLEVDCTVAYENWLAETCGNESRLPGVQFVTKKWWEITREARRLEYENLSISDTGSRDYDEFMLGRIVRDSGLPLPSAKPKLWRHHGVHIGDWRVCAERKAAAHYPVGDEISHIRTLLRDEEFMGLYAEATKAIPYLTKVLKMWRAVSL